VTPQSVISYIKQGKLRSHRIFYYRENLSEIIGFPVYLVKDEYLKLDEIQIAYYVIATLGRGSLYTAKDRATQIKNLQEKIRAKNNSIS